MLDSSIQIVGLQDIGCTEDIPETQPTILGNALQKARYVYQHYHVNCFSEDTGLEVTALDGAPGIYTARYAGAERSAEANMTKLLYELKDEDDRSAQFRTVVALILDGEEYTFEGIAKGHIALTKQGKEGFGYDPVFIPEGQDRSFAQLSAAEKNKISHRAKAIAKLKDFLARQID